MHELNLGAMETRLAELIWEKAPLTTAQLVQLCAREFAWKRTTTYTMLKRLCQRDLFRMENSLVTVVTTREEFQSKRSRNFIVEAFGGSLPAFLAAFTGGKKLSRQEAEQLQKLIDDSRREEES